MGYEYTQNTDIKEMVEYVLPSSDGEGRISVPQRLGWDAIRRIRNAAAKNKVDPQTGKETIEGSMTDYYSAVLCACLLDARTTHNLTHQGAPIQLTEDWIFNEMSSLDAAVLGVQMAQNVGFLGIGTQSAEGNVTTRPKTKRSRSGQATAS